MHTASPLPRRFAQVALAAFLAFALGASVASGQDREISGTVTDSTSGETLPGVNVRVEDEMIGTSTGPDGTYSLTVPGPEAVLIFSFVGYDPGRVRVGDQSVIDVQLAESVAALDEVVVTGYGTQRRQDISGSVSSVDVAEANVGEVVNPSDLIEGRVAGVNIIESSGEPGGGAQIRVRGITSVSGGSSPLYVIDGIPVTNASTFPGGTGTAEGAIGGSTSNPLNALNPDDIENIEILKDASATAIYGSQGANGVVLITTKDGQSGQVNVSYNGRFSAATLANELDLLSGDGYRQAVEAAVESGDLGFDGSGALIDEDGNGTADVIDDLGAENTNFQDEVFRTAYTQNHNLALSGGSESTVYRASAGFLDQPGIARETGLQRYSGRINASHDAFDTRLRFDANLSGSYVERDHTPSQQTGGFTGGVFQNTLSFNPTRPLLNTDGSYYETGQNTQRNPVAILEQVQDESEQTRLIGNLAIEGDLLPMLTARVNVGADRSDATRSTYVPRASPLGANEGGVADKQDRTITQTVFQSTLRYSPSFGDNNLELLGGYEYRREVLNELLAGTSDYISDQIGFDDLTAGGNNSERPISNKEAVSQIGVFGRANYNYDDRYLLQATVRRDGASVFGDDEQWGLFPSASIGWRLSEESFFEDSFGDDLFDNIKLRLSYGVSGNQAIPPYLALDLLGVNQGFIGVFGDSEDEIIGVAQENFANPDLRWESTTSLNAGVDFDTRRFSGTADFYIKDTDDLLFVVPVPQPAVVSTRLENIGSIRNTGFELSLDGLVFNREASSLSIGGNISVNQNEVIDLGGRDVIDFGIVSGAGQTGTLAQRLIEGEALGTFFGPEFVELRDVEGDEFDAPVPVYNDYDENGDLVGETATPGSEDRQIIGNGLPNFTYGLNISGEWRNFDAQVFFRGSQGRDIFNNTAMIYANRSRLGGGNLFASAADDAEAIGSAPTFSSRWIEDGSFVRLDKLTIGYNLAGVETFPVLQEGRVFVSASNLFTITGYDGYDPEVSTSAGTGVGNGFRDVGISSFGIDYTNYPRARTFTVGINFGF